MYTKKELSKCKKEQLIKVIMAQNKFIANFEKKLESIKI